MATIKWDGGTSTDPSVAANWQGGSIPGSSDDVEFDSTASGNCTLVADVEWGSLRLDGSWANTLDLATYTLKTNGDQLFLGGTIDLDGVLQIDGAGLTMRFDGVTKSNDMLCTLDCLGGGELDVQSSGYYFEKCIFAQGGNKWRNNSNAKFRTKFLELGSGNFENNKFFEVDDNVANIITVDASHEISGSQDIIFNYSGSGLNITFPAINAPSWTGDLDLWIEDNNFTMGGDIETDGGIVVLVNVSGSSGTFDTDGYNIAIGGDLTLQVDDSTTGEFSFDNSDVDVAGDFLIDTINAGDTATVNFETSTFYLAGDFLIDAVGTVTVNPGSTATVEMDGGLAAQIESDGVTNLPNFKINKTSGIQVLLFDNCDMGDLDLTDGDFDMNGNTLAVDDLIIRSGADTLTFDGALTVNGDITDIQKNVSMSRLIFSGAATGTATKKLTITGYNANDLDGSTWQSDTGGSQFLVDFGAAVTVLSTTWTDIDNQNATAIDATDATNTDGGGNTNINFGAAARVPDMMCGHGIGFGN